MTAEELHALNVKLRQASIKLRAVFRPGEETREQRAIGSTLRALEAVMDAIDQDAGEPAGRGKASGD